MLHSQETKASSEDTQAPVHNPYASREKAFYTLLILTIVYSFSFIHRQLPAILQEAIKSDLGLSDTQLGLLTGPAFAAFYVIAGLPIARWADRSNRRDIVALCLFIWSFMTAISGAVGSFVQLLLTRIGVAIGQAGCSPPSHSMISDIFPPNKRASAIGFYSMGISIGILFGFLAGGWLNEFFGWRVTVLVVGAPGIVLAIILRIMVAEPVRGLMENRRVSNKSVPFMRVVEVLWSCRSFRHLAMGAGLNAFVGYSISSWTASFMIRSYGMSTGELGTWLSMTIGLGGAVGVLCGGLLADRLAQRDKRWYAWLPALTGLICLPFMAAVYLVSNPYAALMLGVVPGVLLKVYLGSTIATSHSLVGLRMRAMSSAILILIINILGLGLGPWIVGMLSDYLEPNLGVESLRYAMLYLLPAIMFWSVCHFYLAARNLREDLAAALE